jgi:hypothetical protein
LLSLNGRQEHLDLLPTSSCRLSLVRGWTLKEVVVVVCRYASLQDTPEAEKGIGLFLRWDPLASLR